MDNLILKRCKYCDKTYEGTSESCCCSEPCNIKYQKYMKQREKTETPVKIFSIILLLIFFINIMFLPNNPISKYLFIAISLIAPTLHVIFPFGEDKGLQKRGVKKLKYFSELLVQLF
ncbi:hypothetical protein QTG88_11495 [Clostridium perfringens]|nr:hypothetical protein [Clostridium perfringens]